MKRLKRPAEPIPPKFAIGDRVKPTAEAIRMHWAKPGIVTDCKRFTVSVRMDGSTWDTVHPWDYWERE